VAGAIRGDDDHFPPTGCVALENTQNRCGGTVLTRENVASVADVAHAAGIPVHLDGARVINAAVSLGISTAELVSPVDSVTFCLSKALGAPVGSVLCGSVAYIERAHRWRKLLGGGMRQVGVLAAAGLVALEENLERLAEDHANARVLAEGLANVPGIGINPSMVETNIVVFDVAGLGMTSVEFATRLADAGVRVADISPTRIRAVTSYESSREDIAYALEAIAKLARESVPALA
jgi:threonine aldolase